MSLSEKLLGDGVVFVAAALTDSVKEEDMEVVIHSYTDTGQGGEHYKDKCHWGGKSKQ